MFERLLQIIVYVVQELHKSKSLNDIQVNPLYSLGYTDSEISTAISWLIDNSGEVPEEPAAPQRKSFRMLNQTERDLFTEDALSDLLQYSALGLLQNEQIDYIIDRATFNGIYKIDKQVLSYIMIAYVFQISLETSHSANRVMLIGNDSIN